MAGSKLHRVNERKLSAWVEAGLIDTAAAARIKHWEAEHSRPLALWAVIGIGALAIGLGLISVVAANWDAIPAMLRLSLHSLLLIGAAALLWLRGDQLAERQPWGHEGLLFVFGLLGLTFMGHVGQAYQTTSPFWQPLLLWLTLFGPIMLLRGQSWLIAALLMVIAVLAGWNYAGGEGGLFSRGDGPSAVSAAWATGLPVLAAALGAQLRQRGARSAFWRRLEQLGIAYATAGASLIAVLAGFDEFGSRQDFYLPLITLVVYAALAALAAAAVHTTQRDASGRAAAGVLMLGAGIALVAHPLSGLQVVGAVLFIALWAGIAAASLHGGWRGLFQAAVALVALRLIILSFELETDLLTSGAGLIVAGVLILGIAWLAVRVAKRFAPPKEAAG